MGEPGAAAPPLWQLLGPAARVVAAVLRAQPSQPLLEAVPERRRDAVKSLAHQTLRSLGRAQALRRLLAPRTPPPRVEALLCLALAEMGQAQRRHDDHTLVNQAVEAARRDPRLAPQAGFINACLRQMGARRDELLEAIACDAVAQWNHPAWWIERVRRDHPQAWQAVLASARSPAPITLRVNLRRTTRHQYESALAAMNIAASPVLTQGLQLHASVRVADLPGYEQGWFSVQDAAAQCAASLLLQGLRPPPDRPLRLLDACAAPGGKTSHLLELAQAQVLALDVEARRLPRLAENLARLGLSAQVRQGDALRPQDWWDGQPFDGIVLDAPCTASGIVRRHPEVPWLRRPDDPSRMAAVQAALLRALWPLLAPGGRLLYCTCSVFRAEGPDVVEPFVRSNTTAAMLPAPGFMLPVAASARGKLPDNGLREHDGFYFALLEKRV